MRMMTVSTAAKSPRPCQTAPWTRPAAHNDARRAPYLSLKTGVSLSNASDGWRSATSVVPSSGPQVSARQWPADDQAPHTANESDKVLR
jgi:hypothetical protein